MGVFILSSFFAAHFNEKVKNITEACTIDQGVYNGQTLANINDENFMTEENVLKVMKGLKMKNCEGVDRIPLRVLNEGAEILYKPMTVLMKLIYDERTVPDQWRLAK